MLPLVSIIIPVYNLDADLLRSCMASVVGQTYTNLEIILVDDGLARQTGQVCDEIATTDARIRVIHQENQGVSVARNNGTKAANGEYILYVDGDDVLAPIAIQEGIDHITADNVDMVIACVQKISSHAVFGYTSTPASEHEILSEGQLDVLRKHYIALDNPKYENIQGKGYINRGPYCRLINREIALSNPFPGGIPIGEDLLWNMNLLDRCNSVCVVYNIWYGYLISASSAIRKYYGDRIEKVEAYLNRLMSEHREFCQANMDDYRKNVAVEFYCILRFELMSPRCKLSSGEKNQTVRDMLGRKPWNCLNDRKARSALSRKYRVLLTLCRMNIWQTAMNGMYRRK